MSREQDRLVLLSSVIASIALSLIAAPYARVERLPIKAYTTSDGLAHNEINKIVKDSRGFLWFCTSEGLSLFDGYRFTNFTTAEGLPHSVVTDILETRGGDYWVATFGGLAHFNPKGTPANTASRQQAKNAMFTVYTPAGSDRQAQVFTVLLEAHDGTVWIGSRSGLFRVAQFNGQIELLPADIKLPTQMGRSIINALLEDRHGTLWVGANTGLYRHWPDGTCAHYGGKDGLTTDHINALLEDRNGNLWVGSPFAGLLRLTILNSTQPPVVTRIYNRKSGLPTDWVFNLYQAGDGTLWVGTNLGLAEFSADDQKREGPLHVYPKRHGLIFHEIAQISEDRDGNIWLGTAAGAMKLARNGFITYAKARASSRVFLFLSLMPARFIFEDFSSATRNARC